MDTDNIENLPIVVKTFIDAVIKKMRYKKKVRNDVRCELTAHFADALRSCQTDEEKTSLAKEMITDFGDPKILAILIRRGKKRNRPLWKKTIIGAMKAIGIFIVLFFFYSLWFISGKPVISTDYVNVLNKMSRPDVTEGQNAWTDYNKAVELYVKPEEKVKEITDELKLTGIKAQLKELSDDQKEIFTDWLKNNKPAWDHFAAGSQKPYAYRQYGYEDDNGNYNGPEEPWLMHIMMPHLLEIKNISKLGAWQAAIDAERGDLQQALERCLTLIKTGKHLKSSFILIEQLVGTSIQAIGYSTITKIISKKHISVNLLNKLNDELISIYSTGYPISSMEGERLFFLDCVQHMYTKGGPGGGHLVPKKMGVIFNSFETYNIGNEDGLAGFVQTAAFGSLGVVLAGRDDTLKKGNELYDYLNTLTNYTPYQKKTENIKRVYDCLKELSFRHMLIKTLVPALEKVIDYSYKTKAHYEAMLTMLAVLRYGNQKGTLPDDLTQLVSAGYLTSVPADPYSADSLVYKKTEGGFTLYSIGSNFTDEGGKHGTDKHGEKRKWADNGDMVFWPTN
jgi:hypothetical protein